jgi:PIN domain nuclease of toxin-antitoxin system
MKILMDTHAFLWFVEGDTRLSALARETIANPSNNLYLSIASIWERSIKVAKGKLALNPPMDSSIQQWVLTYGVKELENSKETRVDGWGFGSISWRSF